ncbi:MAG TPA: exodeoxyribonuclease VII small subunit [Bacteroides sp.]|jgi:exodeoxyribonuclease VII small subunit|nr:exodeoxyribonuclease VII small subunit [Bacteroides sp.]
MSKDPTYGEAMIEIEEILERIESGELDVDDLTDKVKKVASLLDVCKTKLKTTEVEIQKVIESLEEPD